MKIFVYREIPYERDAVHYMDADNIGAMNTCGPNFSGNLTSFATRQIPDYSQVETALSEEQWRRLTVEGLQPDMVDTLMSPDGRAFEDYIRQSEKDILSRDHGLSPADVERCLAEYPGPSEYFDNGIVLGTYRDFDEAVSEKAWSWGMQAEEWRVRDALENDEDMLILADGTVVEFGR